MRSTGFSTGTLRIPEVVVMRTGLTLLGMVLTALLAGCAVNPVTGDEELMFFGPDKDVELGRKYAPEIEKALGGRFPDENLQSYVNRVGQRMARVCHRPDLAYHFTAVREKGINAFAIPGGYVYITSGLLEKLDSEAQLAAILGHEVGHVVARDTLVAMSRQIGMTALVAAAAIGDAPGDVTRAASFISGVLSLQYSRDDEKDADLVGLSYMVQAGYDPNGMVETMRVLQELQTVRPIEFFSTHPNPESRIAYLEERIGGRYAMFSELKKGKDEYKQNVLDVLTARRNHREVAEPNTP
jgi:predicted Zn-dependent protease